MGKAFFVSDLHGKKERYIKLFSLIKTKQPDLVFIGGDILPHSRTTDHEEFIYSFILPELKLLKEILASKYPQIFIILGNDDPRNTEKLIRHIDQEGYWIYMHQKKSCL